jgi:hypothetical protein
MAEFMETALSSRNGGGGFLVVLEQLGDTIGELRSIAGPMRNAVLLQQDARGIGTRVIRSYHLDRTAIARAVLLDHHNSVIRLLARSKTRQTNHQHRIFLPFGKLSKIVSGWFSGLPAICQRRRMDVHDTRTAPNPSSMAESVVFRKMTPFSVVGQSN